MPSSRAARTVRRTASAPWRCPSGRGAAAGRRPAAIAVHDDRDVVGKWVQAASSLQKTPAGAAAAPDLRERSRCEAEPSGASVTGAVEARMMDGRPPLMRKPPSPPEPSIIRSTLRALLNPRRLIPIVLVSASLVVAQGSYSARPVRDPAGHRDVRRVRHRRAGVVARVVPRPRRLPPRRHPPDPLRHDRAPAWSGRWASWCRGVLGMGHTLLTAPTSVVVCLALFLVGGFGLGRDIVAGEQAGARRGPGRPARARGRRRAAAGAALAPRPALPVQHAERDRRVVPRGRRDRRARGRAAVRDAAHRPGGRARRRPGRWRRSWRCSTRCSSCTGCAIPTACA